MATINDIIDNLEDFQDIQFQTAMDITNDLQTKQLTALENINNSLIDLKNNMSSSSGGNSGSFFDDLLRRVFGDGTGSGGNSGGRGFGGILGILGAGLSLVFEGAKLAFEGIKKTGQVLWDYGKAGVGKAIDVAKNLASGIATGLKNIVSTMVNTISSGVKSLVNMGINSFKELVIQPMLEGAEIYIDTTNQIRKEVGWQKSDYEQFAGSMSRMVGELGNKVGASDILKKAHEVVQLGIKDEEAVSAYTKTLMKMQLALDIDASGMKNLLELTKRLGTQGAQAIEKLGKSIRALDDANLVKALGNKDLMAFAEKMSDVFGGNAEEGSEEWLRENQWAMSGYNALANIDPNLAKGLGDFMTKVANARNDELGDLSVQFGMNMSSVRDAIDRGDIQSVMNSYLAGVNEYIAGGLWNNTKEAKSGYADIFSRSQARRMQRLMEEGKFDVLQLSQKIEEGYLVQRAGVNAVDKEGKDNLEQHISGLNVGLQKEMQNANSALGIHYGEILRDTGANAKDVNWAISKLTEMVTLGFDMVEKLVGSVISGVKGVFDVLVPAPVQTALAIAGVMYIGYRIFGDYLMKAAKGITNYITDAIIGLGNFMLDALPGAMQLAMDVFVGTFNFIIDSLPGMFNLLKDAIIGLGKYIIDSLPGVFNLTVDALSGLGSYLIDAIKGVGNFIVDALPGTLYFLKDVIFGLGYFIKDFALSGILYIKDALGGILHYLVDLLPGLVDYVITAGGQLIHWLWDSLSNILPTIAISLVKTIGEEIFYLGETIVTVVKEGLPLLGELVVEALKSLGTYVWEGLQISGKFIGSWIEYGADLLINKGKEILIEGLEFIAGVFDSFTDKLIDILNLIPGINIEKENPEEREKRRHESLMETFGVKNSDELKPPSFDDWELPSFEKVFDSNAYSDIKKGFIDLNHKTLDSYSKRFTEPLDTLGEGLERAVNDIPDIGEYVTADFFEHAGKYLKRDANGNVMQITDYIGEGTNGSLTDYFDRQSEGKNPIDYLNEQTKGRGIKDYVSEHGGNTNVISYIDQQTGGKNVFDYLKENVGDLSNYLTANGNIMDYLNDSIGDLNSYLNTNGTILDYISEKLKGSPMDYLTANGTPLDYINRQTGGRGINDYIPEMDKQQVMANMKELLGDIGGFVQEGLGESLKLIGVEHGDEIAKQGIDFMKNLFDKATAGASQLMESGQNLLSQVDLNKLLNSAGDIGSLLTNTLSSGLSPLAGGLESLLSNFQNFNQASGVFQRDELSASKSTAHSVADIAKSLNPNYSPPAYEEGTPLVGSGQTFDSNAQVAVLHEGEAVVPADKNPYNNPSANIRDMIDRRDIEGVTREYQNAIRERGISGDFPRSQLKQLQRFISQGEVRGSSGNPLDREAIKDVEGAVRTTTELEIQNANLNADRDSQLQEVQINQGKKNEEQHNLEVKQGIELIEQGKSMIKQGEEDKVIQENHKSLLEKVVENQKSFIDLFKEYHSNWKADRDSDNKFYMDTLNNLMGIHNNTGGIAMILMQTGGNRVGTSQGNRLISTGNVTPLSAPSGNASLDQKADYVYSELIRNGFSKDVAAGIVGNLMNENLAEHDQSHADYYGDGSYAGMGGGMAAWLNERFTGLQDFAKSQGKDWRDLGVQTQFLLKELDNMPNLKQQLLNGNLSVNDAAELFMREFEKPAAEYAHLDRRQSSAQAVRQRDNGAIGGIGSISSGGGDISLPVSTGQQGLIPVSTNQTISPTFQGSIPNYKQYENGQGGKWDASAWGDLQASGCAPTALAIQAQAVTGKTITPADVANWGASAGFRDDKSGLIMQGAKQFGYGVQKIDHATLDSSGSALEALKKGIPVVMGIGAGQLNGLGGQSGHYFTATGIDENGHIKINDPGSNDEYIRQNFSNFTWEDIVAASPDMYVPTLVNMNGQGNIPSVSTPVNQQAVAGGNIMKMIAQVGKDCTKEAWAAITNAYLGTNYTSGDISFDTWASDLEGGQLQAQFHDYSQEDRASFEQQIQSHFSANPNKPIYLYQAGGDGSYGSHKLNRGSGTHATVIGRQLENGKYQVFDSNGGVTHELDLSEIWDSSARGGSGISGNALWIPQISPTKSITGWETSNGQAPGSTGQQGGIPQPMQNGQHLNLNGFQPSFAGQSTFSGISSANFSPANVTGGGSDYQSQVVSLLRGIARALGVDTRAITGAIVQSSNNQGNQLVNAINENGVGGRQVIATGNNPNTNPQNSNFQQGNGVLTGNTNEEKIWGFLKAKGLTDEQVAGIMGNLQQESGFDPTIIEGGGHADSATGASFTQGYGIAQWTFERKDDLENFAKSLGKSSGDLGVQLEFLWHELNNSESEALQALKGATDVATATDLFHRKFERSADAVSDTRIGYGQDIYNKLKGKSFTASNPQQQNINQANQPTQQGQQAIDQANRNNQNTQRQGSQSRQLDEQLVAKLMKDTGLTSKGLNNAVEYIDKVLKRSYSKMGSNGIEISETDIKDIMDTQGKTKEQALEILKKDDKYLKFSEDMLKQMVYSSGEKMDESHIRTLTALGFTFKEAVDTLKLAKGEQINSGQQVEEFIKGTGLSKEFLEKNVQNIIKANNRDLRLLGENGIEISDNDLKYALSLDWIKGDMDKALAFLKSDAKYNEITNEMIKNLTTKDGKHLKIEDLKSLTKMGYTLKEAVDILDNPEELKKLQDKEAGKGNSVAELANSGKGSNIPERNSSPFRVDSEALIQKYMMRDRMVFGSFGQTLADRKGLGEWIVQNKGELPPGYRQWSNPLSRAGMPHLLYGQIQPGVIPTNTNRRIRDTTTNGIDTRYTSNVYRPNISYNALKSNFKSGIDKVLTVELGYKSVRDLQEASKDLRISSKNLDKSTNNMDDALTDISAPSGQKYTKNDLDYLLNNGYTKEQALDLLSKDIKYMKLDLSKFEKSKNNKEFDQEDVRDLLLKNRDNKEYTIDKAIEELSKTDKYSKPLEDLAKLEKEIKERISSGESKDDELGKIVQEIKTTKASDLSNLSLKYGIDTSELESLKKSITSTASRDTNQGNVNLTRDNRGVFYSNGIPVSTPPFISSNVQSRLPYGMQLGDLTVGGGIGGAIGQGLPRSRTTVFGGGFSSQYQQGNLAQTLSPFRTLIQTFFGRDYKKGNEDFATGAQNYRDAIWSGNNFEGNIYSDLKSGVDWLNILFNTGTGSIGRKKVNDILTSTGGVGTHAYQFDQNSFAGMFVGGFNRRQAEKDNSLYLTPGQDNVISYYPSSQLMTGYNYFQQQIPYVQHQQIDYRYSTNQSYQQMKPIEGTYEYYMDKASRAKKKEDMSIFDKLGAHSQEYWLKKAQEAKLSGNVMNIENISKQTSKSVKTSKTEIKEQQIQKEKKYDQNDIAYLRQFNWIKSDEDAKKYLDNNSWKYKDIEWSKYGITQKDNKLFTSDNKEINELDLRKTLDLKEINGDMTKALEYLSEQAKKAGDELSNTGDKVEDVNKQLDKTNPYEGSGINMDFNTWKGGEYFNDKYAVSNKTREFMEERISSEDLMKSLGIKNTSDILTAEQQQALGFREFNKIRTFKDFEVDSALWKQGKKTDTAVEDWLKAHPEAQVKRKDLERVLEDKSNKLDKFEKEENKEKVLEQTDKGFKPEFDELGNIINLDIPEYNIVTKEDDLLVTQAKWDAQNKQMIDYMVGLSKDIERKEIKDKSKEEILDKDINLLYKDKFERIEGDLSKINPDTFKEERDKLGNITNLPGLLKDNVITGQETLLVQEAKRQAQDKEKEKILSDLRGLNDKNVDKTIKEIQKIKTNSEISGLDKFKENTLEKVKEKHIDISEQAQKELRGRHERIVPSQNTIVSSRTQESYREFLDRTPIGDLTVGGGITGGLSRSKPTLFGGGLLSGLIGGTTSLIAGAGGLISDLLFGGKKSQFKKGTYEYNMEMAMNSKRKEDMNPIDKLFSHSQEYYLDKIKSSSISKEEKTITPNKSEIKKNQEIITFGKDKQYKKEHIDYLLSQNWIKDEDEAKKYLDNNSWQYKEVDWTKMGLTQKDNKLFTEDNKEIKEADLRVILDREDIKGDMKKALEYLSSQEKLSQELVDETKTTNSTLEDQIESVPEQTTLNNKEEQLLATKDNIKIDGKTYEDSLKELEGMHDKKYGIDALTGNITGLEIPEELKINQYDSKEVKDVKFSKQQELMQKEVSLDIQELDNKYESQAEMLNYLNKNPELQKSIQEAIDKGITPDTLPEFDNNGNIINIPGILKDNIYNPEMDDLSVRDSKFKAQNQQYAEILEGIRTKQSVELIRQQDDKERNIQDISNKTNITEENQINNGRVKLEKNIEESKAIISDRAESIVIPKDISEQLIEEKATVPSVLPISDKKEEILPVREIKDIFPEEIVPPAIEEVQQPLPESIPLETPTQKIGEDALQNRQKFRQFLKEGSSEEILDYMQNNMNDGTVNSFLLASNTAREIEMSLRDKGASEDDLAKFEWIKNKRDYNQYGGNWDKEITDDKYKWNTYEASLEGGVLSKEGERQLREDIKVNGGYSEKFDLSTQEGTTKYREAQILFNNYDYSTGKFDEKGIKVARQEHEKQLEELNQLRETKTLDESLGNEPESAVLEESIVIPSPLEEKNSESQLAKIEEVKPLEEIKEASFMNRPKIDINDSDSQLARIEELTGSKLSDKMRENFLNQTPEQRAKILDLYEKRGKLPSIGNGIIKIKDDKQEIIESDKVEKNQEEEKSIQDKLENKIELPNNSKLDKLGKTGEFIEKSAKDEISKYDIEGDTAKMTKEQEQEMLDNLAKESNLETIISSTQEEMINPKKGTYEYYMKKAEEAPDKANMGFLGTGLFGEHSKEYWLKKAEKAKVDEVPIQENILLKGMEKVDSGTIAEDTTQINKEVEENIKESSGITKDDIKIEGKTYEESLVDLNKKLDSRYGIDALTGNLTGFDIPEEYKLTGQESEKEKSIKIEKQNELMVKDQELAYKELEDKYTGQAGMLEMINNNSELAKSIEEAEKAGINPDTFVPEFDNNGNITNLPGMLKDNIYNPEADDLGVREAKFKAQNNQYAEILEGIKTKKSTELMDKSGNEKPLSEESKESSVRPNNSQENAVMSPRGIPYEQNDIDYLLNNGYTPEMAYELLSKHPKYMEIDMTQIPKAPNGEEFSEDDIRSLLIEGYELEDAINLLSKNKEYSLDGVSKQEQATQDIGQVSQTTETNMEEFQSVSIQNTSGTAESGEISETINPSSETSSQSTVMDVGNIATQAESARTQAIQMTSSDISSSSSNADMVKWAVSRIEAKLDGVISAIQNSGGNKSVTNNFSNQSNFVPQDNDIVLKPTADSNFSV